MRLGCIAYRLSTRAIDSVVLHIARACTEYAPASSARSKHEVCVWTAMISFRRMRKPAAVGVLPLGSWVVRTRGKK